MTPSKISILMLSVTLGLATALSKSSDHFIPAYSALSSVPHPIFAHHVQPHIKVPDREFHVPNHLKKFEVHPKPQHVYDSPPVYKPEPVPVYRPKQSYEPTVIHHTIESKPFDSNEFTYEPVVVHDVKHKPDFHPKPRISYGPKEHHYDQKPKPYAFDYGVKDDYTGANFGHSETSDGNEVKGSYSVALPDGRIQRVTYTADEYNGFQAEVTYEGEAKFPTYTPSHSHPTYHAKHDIHPITSDYTPPHHTPNIIHGPISKPLQHHIPPYNPVPTPGTYFH